ncbi:hypothetical protein GCM10023085_14050 [Actinomadura viridis]
MVGDARADGGMGHLEDQRGAAGEQAAPVSGIAPGEGAGAGDGPGVGAVYVQIRHGDHPPR